MSSRLPIISVNKRLICLLGNRTAEGDVSTKTERICYYLKIIVSVELLMSLIAWTLVTNLDPLWMRLLAFPYLPILDLITIVVWLACRKLRDRSTQDRT